VHVDKAAVVLFVYCTVYFLVVWETRVSLPVGGFKLQTRINDDWLAGSNVGKAHVTSSARVHSTTKRGIQDANRVCGQVGKSMRGEWEKRASWARLCREERDQSCSDCAGHDYCMCRFGSWRRHSFPGCGEHERQEQSGRGAVMWEGATELVIYLFMASNVIKQSISMAPSQSSALNILLRACCNLCLI
jgi:hypothetical protein